MPYICRLITLASMLLMPFFALSQHFWLHADPAVAAKKSAVRISVLNGDNLKPEPGAQMPSLEKFGMYQAKDSFSLKEQATGTNALVNGDFVKESFLAGAVLKLPENTLLISDIQPQLTKEQKAILALKDTSVWRDGAQAERYHFAKAFVQVKGDKDKDKIYGKQLNHQLEILLNSSPADVKPGGLLVLQVLLHQRVLRNHKITVWRQEKNGKITTSETKTNKHGVQVITLAKAGNYVILVSQEGPHKIGLSDEIEWKSLEASYFFSVE